MNPPLSRTRFLYPSCSSASSAATARCRPSLQLTIILASSLFGNAVMTASSNPRLRVLFANTFPPASPSKRYPVVFTIGMARTLFGPDTTIVSNTPPIVPGGGFGKSPKNSISCSSLTSNTSYPWSQRTRDCSTSATHSVPEANISKTLLSKSGSPYSGTIPMRSVSGSARAGIGRRLRGRARGAARGYGHGEVSRALISSGGVMYDT